MSYDYIRDGAAIYAQSFATIRAESDLARFTPEEARVAVRVIHACGMVEVAADIRFHPDFARAGRAALVAGKPILCDAKMVAHGITKARLPAGNEIVCALDAPEVPALAADGRVPFMIVEGRKGGSAMAVAAVNALASEIE